MKNPSFSIAPVALEARVVTTCGPTASAWDILLRVLQVVQKMKQHVLVDLIHISTKDFLLLETY